MDNPLKSLPPKQQKALIVVGIAAAGYVTWRWMTRDTSAEDVTPETGSTDDDLSGTGVIGSNVGASENVGNYSNTGYDEYDTNNEWFSEAVDRLANGGWDPQAVQSALGEFLTGETLSADEANIVRAAVGAMGGYPPNGPLTIKETPGVTDASKLSAPSGLKVTSTTTTSVTLQWSAVTGAQGYRISRSDVAENIGTSGDTIFTAGGLQPGKKYTFHVAATLSDGKAGPRSSGVSGTTKTETLKAPTGLKVSSVAKTSAKLSWTPTGSGEYLIRRSGSSSTWESVDAAFTATGLKANTKYSYQVAAVKPGSRSPGPWSGYATFTTKR